MRGSTLGAVLVAPGLFLLAACSGDDEPSDEVDEAAAEETVAVAETGCPATSITGTTPSGTEFEAVAAVAASIVDGAAYTLYIGDFDLTVDSFSMLSNPEVPPDGILWTVAVTIFNADPEDIVPIEVGQVVEAGRPFGELTFTVVAQEGELSGGASDGQAGTLTVDAVGDVFCGTIEYSDGEKSISGTFQAPTKAI